MIVPNQILSIVQSAKFLTIFKISNNRLDFFNLSLLRSSVYLEELDLSRNNLTFDKTNIQNLIKNVKIINLNNVKLLDSNSTFGMLLKQSPILQLDLSFTDFEQDFSILDNFEKLVVLKLRQINLQLLNQIKILVSVVIKMI